MDGYHKHNTEQKNTKCKIQFILSTKSRKTNLCYFKDNGNSWRNNGSNLCNWFRSLNITFIKFIVSVGIRKLLKRSIRGLFGSGNVLFHFLDAKCAQFVNIYHPYE